MTKEERQLLLVDLSARLPYGVKVTTRNPAAEFGVISGISIKGKISVGTKDADIVFECTEVKLFLRPMSSMTEEECDMVEEILGDKCIFDFMNNGDIVLKQGQFSQDKLAKLYDYYNSIHVDYRGLIPMGLALEAPKGMYNLNK